MTVALRKVWRDLWSHRGRTALVVLSIAVGVTALGMTTASNAFLNGQMAVARRANRAPHARLTFSVPLSDDAVEAVRRMSAVAEAEGWITANVRWKPALDAQWQEATLTALADYEAQQFDLLELRTGAWPGANEIAVEQKHQAYYGVPPIGGSLYVEANNNPLPLRVVGLLRDPAQSPPPYNPINKPAFYVHRDVAERLLGTRDFNHLRFTVPRYSRPAVERAVEAVEDRLERLGAIRAVETFSNAEFQDPERVAQQEFLNGLSTVLIIMALFSMALSVTLVINTINAILAQQVAQIGIMKTIGGEFRQIVTLYLAGVAVYGLLSLLLAVPLGMAAGYYLSVFWLTVFNAPIPSFSLLPRSFALQLGAGLVTPLLAALWPVVQGASIPVQRAIAAYGLGTGRYGAGWLDRLMGRVQGMPRMMALSLRNTFRRAGRVALTEITLTCAGAIFMTVVTTGASFQRTFDFVWAAWGFDAVFIFDDFHRLGKLEAVISAQPGVDQVEMWVWMQAMAHPVGLTGPGHEREVQVRGVPHDTRMFRPALTAGRQLDPDDGHALVLNQKLAQELALGVGDRIAIDLGGGVETTWTIVGTAFDVGVGGHQNTVFMWRDVLTADLGRAGRATVAQVGISEDTFEAQERLKQNLQDYFESQKIDVSFATGQIENRRLGSVLWNLIGGLLQLMTLVVAIVGGIGLAGTLSINIIERRREIGVMRAVGASSADVALIFMGEGLLLGVLSWAQAIPLSMLGARYFVEALGSALRFPFLYSYSLEGMWLWLAIVVVLALLASWLPARAATRISVRQSLAYE